MKRMIFLVIGYASLVAGFIGLLLPIVPTVPFLLLAAYCFSKGSERLHRWMLNHPTLGPPIRDWEDGQVIRPQAKRMATVFVFISFGAMTVFAKVPWWLKAILDAIALGVLIFIWSRPSAKVGGNRGQSGEIPKH